VISGCGHAESALAAEAQLTAAPQRGEVKAAETVRGIRGVEVVNSNADVDENGNLSSTR
jgi:hypothetical protein